jgi:hypothetical protein
LVHLIAFFNPYGGYNRSTNNQVFRLTSPAQLTAYNLLSNNRFDWGGLDMSLNYQLGFKSSKERLLTFSYKYSNGNNPQRNELNFINRQNCTDPIVLQMYCSREGLASIITCLLGSRELIKDKLTISAGVNNPFMKYRIMKS